MIVFFLEFLRFLFGSLSPAPGVAAILICARSVWQACCAGDRELLGLLHGYSSVVCWMIYSILVAQFHLYIWMYILVNVVVFLGGSGKMPW